MKTQMKRLVAVSFVVFAVAALLTASASATSLTWSGLSSPTNILWSDINNWAPNIAHGSGDDICFGNTAGYLSNEVATSDTINSLWYQQTDTAYIQSTLIDAGQILKVQGFAATAPSGYVDKYSLYAGNVGAAAASTEKTVITGAGGLDVSGPGGVNTTGDIIVALTQGSAPSPATADPDHTAILDLSGLATFNANVDQMLIGVSSASTGSNTRPNGIMYLAHDNTIVLNNALSPVAASGGTATPLPGGALVVGYTSNSGAGDTYICALYLGHTNTISADYVLVGGVKRPAAMGWESTTDGSSMTLRGTSQTRVKSLNIGDLTNNSTGGNPTVGTVDLRGGTVNIMADTIVLGQTTTNYVGVNNRQGYGAKGYLYVDAGTVDTTTMVLANQATNLNSSATSIVGVSGTATLTIGSGGLTMANYNGGYTAAYYGACNSASATMNISGSATVTVAGNIKTDVFNLNSGEYAGPNSGRSVASNINITGGSLTVNGDITSGVATSNVLGTITSQVTLNGGTLDMTGHSIGPVSATTGALSALSFQSGTLKNVGGLNSTADGTTMNKTTTGLLVLDGANTYAGTTKVSAGTLKFASTMTLASTLIDVAAAGTLDVTAFGGGYTVAGGKTLEGNGLVNGSATILGALAPGESTGQLTIAGSVSISGTLAEEINGNVAGTSYDQLVVTDNGALVSNVTLGGTLAITSSYTAAPSDVFWIINDTSATGTLTGTFGTVTGMPAGWQVLYNVDFGTTNLTPGSGNDVAIVLVPEPATWLMLIAAAGLGLLLKRFRNK
jgi:autotransporter-associated beta strand protein